MDINSIMKQAQKMQKQFENKKKEFEETEYFFVSNGGAIKIKMKGSRLVTSLEIEKDLLGEDKEMLQDMLMVAFNEAINSIDDEFEKTMESISGKMNLPGAF